MLLCGYNMRGPGHMDLHKPRDEETKLSERYFYMEKIQKLFFGIFGVDNI